jgi:hypothetical protein
MSNEVEFAALTERVAKLEQYLPDIHADADELAHTLIRRAEEYQGWVEARQSHAQADLSAAIADLQNKLAEELSDLRKKFNDRVQQEISKVTAEEIASSLSRKVLVTRPATRDELKDADVLKIRQATSAELRQQ